MQNKKDGVAFNKKINLVDKQTGKSVYTNSDVVDMAAFSIKRCGTGAYWGKVEFAGISLRCTECGHLASRFVNQINGFWCYKCNNKSDGLNIALSEEELSGLEKCEKGSYRTDDQSNCVSKILKPRLDKHNDKYKFLPNGEPTLFHKLAHRLKPFFIAQKQIFKELFTTESNNAGK